MLEETLKDIMDALNTSSNAEATVSNPHHFLFLLGTDTQFTPIPTKPPQWHYLRGETLSYSALAITSLLQEIGHINTELTSRGRPHPHSFYSNSVDVLNGPEMFGRNVGRRIAHAVYLCLLAIAKGKTTINIAAHSRGAVIAILVGHELRRIQKSWAMSPTLSLYEVLIQTPSLNTKQAIEAYYSPAPADDAISTIPLAPLQQRLNALQINAFLIDPVPGDGPFSNIITWHDHRFYEALPFDQHQFLLCQDERSSCFSPLIPPSATAIFGIPGHHGTASGNCYAQNGPDKSIVIDITKTTSVQALVLCKLFYFMHQNTKCFEPPLPSLALHHPILDEILNTFLQGSNEERETILLEHYNKTQADEVIYRRFRTISYISYIPTSIFPIYSLSTTATGGRLVHSDPNPTICCDMATLTKDRDNGFINQEHEKLARQYVNKLLGINIYTENDPLTSVLAITTALQNIRGSSTNALLENTTVQSIFLHVFTSFVDMTSQSYLKQRLSRDAKSTLMNTLRQAMDTLEHSPTTLLNQCKILVQQSIKKTTETHYQHLLTQTNTTLSKLHYLTESPTFFSAVYKPILLQLKITFSPEASTNGTSLEIDESSDEIKTIEDIKIIVDHYSESLSAIEEDTARTQQLEKLCELTAPLQPYFEANAISTISYITESEQLWEASHALADGLLSLQALASTPFDISIPMLFDALAAVNTQLGILLATQYTSNLDRPLVDVQDPTFKVRLKRLAVIAGATSPEEKRLKEVETALQNLTANRDELSSALLLERNFREQAERNTLQEKTYESLITEKLLPLTQHYLHHLCQQRQHYFPMLDFNEGWPQKADYNTNQGYQALKSKFDTVSKLHQHLINPTLRPSERLQLYHSALTTAQQKGIKHHRGTALSALAPYCLAAFIILFTGILPGLIGLGLYARQTGRSPLFFAKSTGENYLADCRHAEATTCCPG